MVWRGKASDFINKCGRLTTIQPTILGRNVTFSFTPDSNDPDAKLAWRRKNDDNPWAVLPRTYKFTQFHQNGTYYLVLTDTVRSNDEQYYQIHYTNESMHCFMETPKLRLKDISREPCGFVYLRTTRPIEGETVEIEYYPSNYYPDISERTWVHSANRSSFRINLNEDVYEEETEQNDKFVFRMFHVYSWMNGVYSALCGKHKGYSSQVSVQIQVPPSIPTFEGLKDIDGCEKCIAGESGEQMQVNCTTSGGTEPITLNLSVGNETLRKPLRNGMAPGFIALFTMRDKYHMENLTFSIMNDALVSPLSFTARMYVIKPPGSLLITAPKVLKEKESVNITCVSDGARPAPTLTVDISGTEVSPVQHTNYFNKATSLNTDFVSLTTFKRNWNEEKITCCRYSEWYKNKTKCSTSKQVNYLFPPSKIKLTVNVNVEEGQPYDIQGICRIYESNPVCVANFNVPNDIMITEIHKKYISQHHGAWISESAINLNTSKEDEGRMIRCTAECSEFAVDLIDTALITLPYAPVVKLNMSGQIVDINKGEQEHVKCSAQSVPASNITWIELLDNDIDVTKNQCLSATDCVMEIDTQLVLKREFLCQAQYFKTVDHKILIVNIIEKKEERLSDDENAALTGKSIIWVIVGAGVGVSANLLVTFLVIRHRRRNTKAKRGNTCVDVVSPEATYTQLDGNMATTAADGLYSELSKTENSNPSDGLSKHSKTVADLAIESQTAEAENVYVNEKVK